jgi:signal transduction histidine kinase
MLLQKNSQRRSQSSTRSELARDLHDSLAQELVAIGFHLDLLIAHLPHRYRAEATQIRAAVTLATKEVRRELFALREIESDYQAELIKKAAPLSLQVTGNTSELTPTQRKIIDELIKNAADHSKGHHVHLVVESHLITVSDDGQGMRGVCELVDELGGTINVMSKKSGTKVEIRLP